MHFFQSLGSAICTVIGMAVSVGLIVFVVYSVIIFLKWRIWK